MNGPVTIFELCDADGAHVQFVRWAAEPGRKQPEVILVGLPHDLRAYRAWCQRGGIMAYVEASLYWPAGDEVVDETPISTMVLGDRQDSDLPDTAPPPASDPEVKK
jgi:hypothetical protein